MSDFCEIKPITVGASTDEDARRRRALLDEVDRHLAEVAALPRYEPPTSRARPDLVIPRCPLDGSEGIPTFDPDGAMTCLAEDHRFIP